MAHDVQEVGIFLCKEWSEGFALTRNSSTKVKQLLEETERIFCLRVSQKVHIGYGVMVDSETGAYSYPRDIARTLFCDPSFVYS